MSRNQGNTIRRAGDVSEMGLAGAPKDSAGLPRIKSSGPNWKLVGEGATGLAGAGVAGVVGIGMMAVPGGQIPGAGVTLSASAGGSFSFGKLLVGLFGGTEQDGQTIDGAEDFGSFEGKAGAVAGGVLGPIAGSDPEKSMKKGASAGSLAGSLNGMGKKAFGEQKQALKGLQSLGIGRKKRKELLELERAFAFGDGANAIYSSLTDKSASHPEGHRSGGNQRAGDASESSPSEKSGGGGGGGVLQH